MVWKPAVLCICLLHLVICEEVKQQENNDTSVNIRKKIELGVNNLGYNLLLKLMDQNKDHNVILSPVSIAGLLAMTLLGTVGKANEELAGALRFSPGLLENRDNHAEFGKLLQSLNSVNESLSKTLYANTIFVDERTKLRNLYRTYLNYVYKSDLNNVDFQKGIEAANKINEWVSNHTMEKIKNFLDKPLPSETQVVLLSALYFRGQWKQPFLPKYTIPMPFQKPDKEIMVDLMLNAGNFDYIFSEDYGMHMIALPYNDSITTMYALKSFDHRNQSLLTLLNRLDYEKIDQFINQMVKSKAVIRFPKMEVENNVKLEQALKSLGVRSLFNPVEANFALMVEDNANRTEDEVLSRLDKLTPDYVNEVLRSLPNPGIYVDSVLHDVRLSINEYGTEAVAASASLLARTAKLFYADSPFYMFIRNEETKMVTFSAVIFDPLSS